MLSTTATTAQDISIGPQPRIIDGTEVIVLTEVARKSVDDYKGQDATFTSFYSPDHQILI
ncbi:MAG: hypothetical protein ACPGUX_13175 [Halocynthiibacter sp.]